MSFLRASQEKVKPLRASSDGSHANSNTTTTTAPQQEGEGATVGSLFLIPDTKYAIAWICDECHNEIEADKRYKSFEVPDFDLCESCYQQGKHPFPMFLETPEMGTAEPVQGSTSAHTLTNLWKRYMHRPCFGTRERLQDGSYGDFQWVTYNEVFTRSCTFASGLHSIFQPGDFIGICARNRLEWYIADYACLLYHFIPIPIHTTIDSNSIKHIINNAQIKGVICSKELLPKFIQASSSNCPSLLYLIQMEDGIEEGAQTLLQSSSSTLKLVSMKQLFDAGEKNPVPMPPFDSVKPDDIVTLCYTSGSTGVPKGAIITDFILNSDINVQYTYPDPYVVLSFSPLAHTERTNVMQSLVLGGRVGIFGEEMDTLFDSFRKLRPTLVSAVPRLYNKLYSDFKEAVAKRHALDPKKPLAQVEEETLRRFEGAFGGRTAMLVTGGAPSSEAVKAWLARCFCCTVYDGYGATECGSICTETYVHENVQVKLVDVPEMQYFSSDLPYPRGEIYVKSDMVIPGYYNNPEETEKAIKDGWFCTGDIGTLIDGKLHIIDRKKNFFKLAQGEYVAPERLETIFLESPFLDQLCIWGDSLKDCLIAICVINKTVAKEWLLQNKQIEKQKEREEEEESWDALCQNVQLKRAVMKDFGRIAAHHKDDLAAYEVPRGVILDACGWNADNGLMTPTNKVCRRAIAQHYKKEIESAYLELEVDRSTTKEKVFQVLKQVLPGLNGGEEIAEEGDFSSLGGDSLSAVQVVQQLNEAFQVDMPLDVFFQRQQNDSGASIDDLSRWIDQQLSFASVSSSPSSSSTYYSSSASYRLRLATFSADAQLEATITLPPQPSSSSSPHYLLCLSSPKKVLLTGSTGFLGIFLLQEILRQCPEAQVLCLVRASNEQAAKQRILSALRDSIPSVSSLPTDWEERIVALVGDLSKPLLGLSSEEQFAELSRSLDAIYHNGAMVHGVLSYESLKAANVEGTREVLRLACSGGGRLALHYVSTLSVFDSVGVESGEEEERRILYEDLSLERAKEGLPYCGGYSQSKWVAERLVQQAKARGLPVTIFRPGTIGGHSLHGFSNKNDFLGRVICGLAHMNCYPSASSLQEEEPDFNMAPVDWVASSIVALSREESSLGKHFHLIHPHSNALKLSHVVKFIDSWKEKRENGGGMKGFPYVEWYDRLKHDSTGRNVLLPLISSFSASPNGFPIKAKRNISLVNTIRSLEALHQGEDEMREKKEEEQDGGCPPITEDVFHRYLDFFASIGFLQ